jgi:hypothetical protein
MTDMDKWIAEGEALMDRVDKGGFGLCFFLGFSIGAWWADRPWRVRHD